MSSPQWASLVFQSKPNMLDFRKSEDGFTGEVPEEDPKEAKKKRIKREADLEPAHQTPTISSDHFATEGEGIIALKKFLAGGGQYGFPGTDGSRWSNFKEYLKNSHPLLSIWTAHDEHPFDHKERLQYLFCMISLTFMFSAIFQTIDMEPQAICDDGCELVSNPKCGAAAQCCLENCATGIADGDRDPTKCELWASEQLYDEKCHYLTQQTWVQPLVIALITIPTDMLMRAFVVCGWVQGWSIQKPCEDVGACCMGLMILYAFGFLIIGIVGAAMSGAFDQVITTFVIAQVESWVIYFFKSFVIFNIFFGGGKAKFRKRYPGLTSIETEGLPKVGDTGVLALTLPDLNVMKKAVNDKFTSGLGMLGIKGPNVQQELDTQAQMVGVQQHQHQHPSATSITIMVVCPEGVAPGQQIQFVTTDGYQLMAVVPAGVVPGQNFPVMVGPPPPEPQVTAVPPSAPTQSKGGFSMPGLSSIIGAAKKPAPSSSIAPKAGGLLDFRSLAKKK